MDDVRLDGKTVSVTGCNTGIGKETARELSRRGAHVVMACRNLEKAEAARQEIMSDTGNTNIAVRELDLSSLESVRMFASEYIKNEERLDILVNNAGFLQGSVAQRTQDGFELHLGVNHLGPFLLTNLLLEKLKACTPSRVVILSSVAHEHQKINFNDLQNERVSGLTAYGRSKAANVMFGIQLAKELQGSGVTVYSLHPGFVESEFLRDYPKLMNNACIRGCLKCCAACFCMPLINVEEGAQTSLYCCMEPSIAEHSGRYYAKCKEKAAKAHATDPERCSQLWKVSAELTGFSAQS